MRANQTAPCAMSSQAPPERFRSVRLIVGSPFVPLLLRIEGSPMLHLNYPTVPADSPDAAFVAICQQMLGVFHEQDALVERDHHAPDSGPNHERHEALHERFCALAATLTKAEPPTTPEGIRALAAVSLLFGPVRSFEGELLAPESLGEWLRLFALTCAAGKPEAGGDDRDVARRGYWAEPGNVRRAFIASRLCHQRGRGERAADEDRGADEAQVGRHGACL
jgi:hypothetical protein